MTSDQQEIYYIIERYFRDANIVCKTDKIIQVKQKCANKYFAFSFNVSLNEKEHALALLPLNIYFLNNINLNSDSIISVDSDLIQGIQLILNEIQKYQDLFNNVKSALQVWTSNNNMQFVLKASNNKAYKYLEW